MSKKFLGYCEECKKSLCEEHAYFRVDGNNEAITNNAPYLCRNCYENKYNEKIESDIDIFRKNLIVNLFNLKRFEHIEIINIDNLIKYIQNL